MGYCKRKNEESGYLWIIRSLWEKKLLGKFIKDGLIHSQIQFNLVFEKRKRSIVMLTNK